MAKMIPTVHNPTHFEPADYTVEDYLDNHRPRYVGGPVEDYNKEVTWWEANMQRALGTDWRAKSHRCIHCGNGSVRWITAVKHLPTNEVVVFGATCTDRLSFANKVAFKLAQLQARAAARKVRFTIWNKRMDFLSANPAIVDVLAHINDPAHAKNFFVNDVLRKFDQYGSLSQAQVNAVVSSIARDYDYVAKKAAEASEPKADAPSGRVAVTGTVLTVKTQDSDWGISIKMLVKLDDGAKVWCTAPSGVERNDRVTVRATWTPSKDDKSFAFGSRPHLVSRTQAVAA